MSFSVTDKPLSLDQAFAAVAHPGAGAVVLFVGMVRDENLGRSVVRLDYEAYPSMAVREMQRIADEIEARYAGVRLSVAHRVGTLEVGALAVLCAASAPHRGEAFAACRALIDAVKARVPVWKREWGHEGPYWVGWEDARCLGDDHPEHGHGAHPGHEKASHGL
ncbi:MAG: molybdenum cofactor biosynthesis protein MoaE [Myxococcales bacterium]|nr:molybdenum cofactor biosynthesis protein MoaE [Myxococcales bacterium]